ncbi:hypothetical protein Micbo1qcDRAFT_197967 [Microdochium bolleyi]|uniref:C2H2-type domain-containing protein n=1 Tax=Microdochium bolleyi TaxID=196109 RepID=A0A136IQ69_9PEZI|nr:hypothetical protein Micbo1qcDRAFT_197967 [Microdochium bolleyi]
MASTMQETLKRLLEKFCPRCNAEYFEDFNNEHICGYPAAAAITSDIPRPAHQHTAITVDPSMLSLVCTPEPPGSPPILQQPTPPPSPETGAHSKPRRQYACCWSKCCKTFPSEKDRIRHERTHDKNTSARLGTYRCICGKTDSRRDNHRRHVETCRSVYSTTGSFVCAKGCRHATAQDHLDHLTDTVHGCASFFNISRKSLLVPEAP